MSPPRSSREGYRHVRVLRRLGRAYPDQRRPFHLPKPRLHVAAISAGAGFHRPAVAVGAELEGLVASATAWGPAVRHHASASQSQPRPVHLCRKVMRPRVRSYGDKASVTRSPASTRMRKRRILPAMVASTEWPFGKWTRKVVLGSTASTMPSISIACSFAITPPRGSPGRPRRTPQDQRRDRRIGQVPP